MRGWKPLYSKWCNANPNGICRMGLETRRARAALL
jgi:hypothetical protein